MTQAILHTNRGDITIDLFPDHAPRTVASFVGLAKGEPVEIGDFYKADPRGRGDLPEAGKPFYDGLIFHRVIEGFMLQGGDPTGTGMGGPGYVFGDEVNSGLAFDKPYLLAMANAGPGTNGSQFFITVAPTAWLTGKHTIFGEVADDESKKVVDAIGTTRTGAGDRPVDPVVIESVEIK